MNTSNSPNPFPGLRPFRSDEHHLFFGREEQTAALLQLLRTNRFLAVVGTSGSGKSSLVRAGMIAELHGGTMTQAGSTWEVMLLRPGGSPIENLARAFVDAQLYEVEDPSTLPRLLATLNRSRFGLVEAMKQSDVFEPGANLLVVVDQFEELFRFRQQGVDSEETAAAFVNLLLTASEQSECPIYVTITMRSDYLGDCSEIPGLAEAVNDGEYLIPRLLRDQKRDAIEKPIGVGGAKIAPLLVQRLLNDVGDDPDQLPVLQHALMRMWDVWSADSNNHRPIDIDDFEATGGLGAALSNHADEIYDSLPDDNHRAVGAKIFKTLTEKGTDNRGIRRPTRLAQLQAIAATDRATMTTVLDAYRRTGVTFLMPGSEAELGDRTVLDLSHESLMRGWQRLRGWVEEEAQSARIFRRLLDTARLWREGKAGLFHDPDLQIALSWREQVSPNAEWAEQYGGDFDTAIGFLETSNAEVEAERQAKEAARQRELEQAQELAESRQQRLEQQQRSARRLRKLLAGLAAVAVLAGVACVAALVARNEAGRLAHVAEQEATNARQNEEKARQSQKETANALVVVESQKAKAEAAERVARAAEEEGRKLLYTTDMRLAPFVWRDDRATAEQLRVLLAKHVPDPKAAEAKSDLRGFEWRYYQHLLNSSAMVFSGRGVPIFDCAFSSDTQLVTLDQNSQVRRWDLATQLEDQASRRDLPEGAHLRVLSPDGRLVALADGNRVRVFDAATAKQRVQVASTNTYARKLLFTPANDRLVIVDNKVRWVNALNGEVIATVNRQFDRIESLAVSDDGLTLAVVGHGTMGHQFSIFRLDPAAKTVTPLARDAGQGGTLRASALSPDGRWIAIGNKLSPNLTLFETSKGEPIGRHGAAHGSLMTTAVFANDGLKLVTADAEGTIKIWTNLQKLTAKSTAFLTLKGHRGAIQAVRFSRDGKRLASVSDDATARVWDLEDAGAAIRPADFSGLTLAARFSPDGRLIAAANGTGVRLWDASTGQLVRSLLTGDNDRIHSVAFSPSDPRLLAVGYGGQGNVSYVALWDIDTGVELARLLGATDLPGFQVNEHSAAVGALAFSQDGKYLACGFGSKMMFHTPGPASPLKIWEVATRQLIRRLTGHTGHCTGLDFSPDGKLLASSSRDGTAILWSTKTWKAAHTLQNPEKDSLFSQTGKSGMIEDVAFAPDGKTLALASREGSIQLWDVATGRILETVRGHSSNVSAVAFSPDGRTLASGSGDQTVRIWNVETRRELMQLDPGSVELGQVHSLAFSPDGLHLLAGGNRLAFWSAAPLIWNDTDRAAAELRLLLQSKADFQSRFRLLSENLRLHEALAKLDTKDERVQAALAAAQANWHASRQAWPEAVAAVDRLLAAEPNQPEAWLRTPGLLRLATALLNLNRPADAARLLQSGAKRRAPDGLTSAMEYVGIGMRFSSIDGTAMVTDLLPGSPASRSRLRPEDVITKVDDTELTRESLSKLTSLLAGKAGTKVRLTVRRSGSEQLEVIELTRARFVHDSATGELLHPLRTAINERLVKEPGNPGLLELRAELAGQWSEAKAQVADYTAAIDALSKQKASVAAADLKRLYAHRGNAHVALRQWQQALDDYARVVTDATTDGALLANQALAQANAHAMTLPVAYVRLGRQNEAGGIELVDYAPDGATKPAEVEAQECRLVPTGSRGWSHAYFAIDKGFKWASVMDAQVEMEYWADSTGRVVMQADALDSAYRQSPQIVQLDGTREWKTGRFMIKGARFANSQNGRADFRFLVTTSGRFYLKRVSVRRLIPGAEALDPWVQLAGSHYMKNDWDAIGKLVGRHPASTAAIGDLLVHEKQWQRAIEIYSKTIKEQMADGDLLSKRARAHEALKNWDAAAADWSRAATGNPDGARLLAEFARRLAENRQRQAAVLPREAARKMYEQALQSDAENHIIAEQLTQLLAIDIETGWTVLKPTEMTSQIGAKLTLQEDGSILVSGNRSGHEIFTIVAPSDLARVSAIRLEALPHSSLGGNGPGRHESGLFKLAAFKAFKSKTKDAKATDTIRIASASASYETPESKVAGTIDARLGVGWQNWGQLGTRQEAIFRFETPVGPFTGERLIIQIHMPDDLSLGCFRLSMASGFGAFTKAQARLTIGNDKLDTWARLAAAYALNDCTKEALQYFSTALERAASYEARKPILQLAAHFDEVLSRLSRHFPDDPQLQSASAQQLAERGKILLAEKQPAKAQGELQKARELLTRLRAPRPWSLLRPAEMKGRDGEVLTLEPDGSIFVSGPNPERGMYELRLQTDLPTVSGILLETIPDGRLPDSGSGRSDSGNFHLAELTAAFISGKEEGKVTPLDISSVIADEQQAQAGYDPSTIFDGNPRTYWDTYPRNRLPHWVACSLKTPVRAEGRYLRVMLDSGISRWGKHGLGRFRLWVTGEADALAAARLRGDLDDSVVVDLLVALAKAHGQQGRTNNAVAACVEALALTLDRAGKASIITEAAALPGVLEKLAERAANDALFQARLAQHYADRGNLGLADAARAKARALFEEKLAKEPDSTAWAAELADVLPPRGDNWAVLTPVEMKAESGAKMEMQSDGSIFVQQKPPVKTDTYSLVFQTDLKGVRGLRLETLPDSRILNGGSGWGGDGNFVLNELTLQAAPAAMPGKTRWLTLRNAAADFSQSDWPIRNALDGNNRSGWAVSPQTKREHMAVFELAEAVGDGQATRLTVRLQHSHWDPSYVMGRFRLSVSLDPATLDWERKRLALMNMTEPWAKLAAAYHQIGDQPALERLLIRHPAAIAGIGDLYAAEQNWERAIAEYTKAITPDCKDARLFAARAEAHAKLEHWELAIADWEAADRHAPDKSIRFGNPAFPAMQHVAQIYGHLQQWEKQVLAYTELLRPERVGDNHWLYRGRGEAYDQLRQWDKALADHEKAFRTCWEGERDSFQLFRARHFALRGLWKQAAKDAKLAYQRPMQVDKEWWCFRDAALIFAIAGDEANYRKMAMQCSQMQSSDDSNADNCKWTTLTMLLLPNMITNANRPRLLALAEKNDAYWRPRLTAAIHFRSGSFKQAAELFDANGSGPQFLFLAAMTQQKLGNQERAKQLLAEGNTWVREQFAKDPGAAVPRPTGWHDWACVITLQLEAFDLVLGRGMGEPRTLALQGQTTRAAEAYAKALTEAADQTAKSRILDELIAFDDIMTALRRRFPDDKSLQEAYRRMVEKTVAELNRKLDTLTGQSDEAVAARSQLIGSIIHRQDEALARLLKLRPNDTLLHASHSVIVGDWKNAAAGYAKLTEENPKADSVAWMVAPTLWAYAGETSRHREICQKMYERYRDSTTPEDTERCLKMMMLVQSGLDLPPQGVTKFLASIDHSKAESRAWFTEARALMECRHGKYAAALESVDEALALERKTPQAAIKCIGLAVRSLTYAKQKDVAKARETLDQVKQVMTQDLKMTWKADGLLDGSTILNGATVDHDKLIPEILRREAEKLVPAAAGSLDTKRLGK